MAAAIEATIAGKRAEQLRTPGVHKQTDAYGPEAGVLCVDLTALEEGHNDPLDHLPSKPLVHIGLSPTWTPTQL